MAFICRKEQRIWRYFWWVSNEYVNIHWNHRSSLGIRYLSYRCHWPVLPDARRRLVLGVAHARDLKRAVWIRYRLGRHRPPAPVCQVLSGSHVLRYLRRWSAVSVRMVNFYPWKRLDWLCGSCNFIFVLLAGLVYLVRIGALDWTPARSRRERMNPETNSIANRQR